MGKLSLWPEAIPSLWKFQGTHKRFSMKQVQFGFLTMLATTVHCNRSAEYYFESSAILGENESELWEDSKTFWKRNTKAHQFVS